MRKKQITNPETGETLTSKEWCKKLGVDRKTFWLRLQEMPAAIAFSPKKTAEQITNPSTGECLTIREWAEKLGIQTKTFRWRLKNRSLENCFSPDLRKERSKGKILNPQTKERFTAREWAEIIDTTEANFLRRLKHFGLNDPRTFEPIVRHAASSVNLVHKLAQERGTNLCTNPLTKKRLLASEWAYYYQNKRVREQIKPRGFRAGIQTCSRAASEQQSHP